MSAAWRNFNVYDSTLFLEYDLQPIPSWVRVSTLFFRRTFLPLNGSFHERIMDGQLFYPLTMLQIFAVQGFTAGLERGGDYQAVVKVELVAGLYVETTLVKHPAGVDLPQREQHLIEKLHGILGCNGNSELFRYDIERFLYNLKADKRAAVLQCVVNQGSCNLPFMRIVFIKQIDENVTINKVTAHSSHPA